MKTIQTGTFRRSYAFERATVDEEARTAEVTFSTETPVERFFGPEILDHGKGSVRLDRLLSAGPLLMEHDPGRHIGVIESASVSDGQGRAMVRFGSSSREAQEAFGDVLDGIKRSISVGYRVHRMVREEHKDGEDTYRVTDWEPFEVSLVSMPADTNATIGRDALRGHEYLEGAQTQTIIEGERAMSDDIKIPAPEPAPVTVEPTVRAEVIEAARKEEQVRCREINGVAALYPDNADLRQMANKAIEEGTELVDFQRGIIPILAAKPEPLPMRGTPDNEIGMSDKERKQFSLVRLLDAMAGEVMEGKPVARSAPFEVEACIAAAERYEREPNGMYIPEDVLSRGWGQRVAPMDTSENSHLVGTDHLAGSFIDALRATAVLMRLGARSMTGLRGDVSIPRLDTPATWNWLAEDGSVTAGEQGTGAVTLSPTTVAGAISVTRRLMKQSSPDVEQLVRNDLVVGAALEIDKQGLQGTGSSNLPTGVLNTSGIGTSTISSAGQPTHTELIEFETDVETGNALMGSLAYIVTPAVKAHCKDTLKDSGVSGYLWEPGNRINDYPAMSTNQMPSNGILFGNFTDVIIGFWGGLDLMVDPYTDGAKGGLVIRAFQDIDIGVRHAASFSKNA